MARADRSMRGELRTTPIRPKTKRENPLVDAQGRAHVKARRKQQPAQAERLQRNLAGDGLVVFRAVLDLDAAGLQLEQVADGQFAAPVAHGDDDPADAFALHELGQFIGFDGRDGGDLGIAAHIARRRASRVPGAAEMASMSGAASGPSP